MNNNRRNNLGISIQSLTVVLIICYIIGYMIQFANSNFLWYLTLDVNKILQGQIWRLVTWILIPPSSFDIFTLISLFFYFSIGTALERTWGQKLYNRYIFTGLGLTIVGAFICYFVVAALMTNDYDLARASMYGALKFSTYYINMSIFLAFAATFPEAQVLLMFVIPVKVKWMGIIYGLILVYSALTGGNIYLFFAVGASLANFLIFFITTRKGTRPGLKQRKRQREFNRQVKIVRPSVDVHKCAVCGQTSESNPGLEFRFCSKCSGNKEYCQEHLFTHIHE